MASAHVECAISRVFLAFALTMSHFNAIRFLELILVNMMHPISLSVLLKSFWNKHAVEMASKNPVHEELAKEYGIKGTPVLSILSSLSFPLSFPFNFMHLVWENLIPNLILFWTAKFKDLNHEGKSYVIAPHIWSEVGAMTAKCSTTIPAVFGASVPNIAMKQSQMTAEMYANWTLYIALIVLHGRFEKDKYYKHFMQLVKLLKLCLLFEIDETMLNQIDEGFKSWVQGYET